jgi:hypothetical protein
MASSGSTLAASCATRSTRRSGSTEKFWTVSPKILPLPTMVNTLSGVMMVVPNRPSSRIVPTTPPMLTKSPTLKGRRISMKAPAAKLPSNAAPGRPDRHAGTGQHGRERGGLDPEVAQDAQHQRDVQRNGDDGAQVLGQRRIDMVAVHGRLHHRDDAPDQPAADDPEGNGGQHLDRQFGDRGAQEVLN